MWATARCCSMQLCAPSICSHSPLPLPKQEDKASEPAAQEPYKSQGSEEMKEEPAGSKQPLAPRAVPAGAGGCPGHGTGAATTGTAPKSNSAWHRDMVGLELTLLAMGHFSRVTNLCYAAKLCHMMSPHSSHRSWTFASVSWWYIRQTAVFCPTTSGLPSSAPRAAKTFCTERWKVRELKKKKFHYQIYDKKQKSIFTCFQGSLQVTTSRCICPAFTRAMLLFAGIL